MWLGQDLLAWMVLAIGGAMAVGNLAALAFPPRAKNHDDDPLDENDSPSQVDDSPSPQRASVVRCLVFVMVGSVSAVWALVSLLIR